jgi:group II intron reverse transcriptase/maturase
MHQWYWCAPFNPYNRSWLRPTCLVIIGSKGLDLSDAEKLRECSMSRKVSCKNGNRPTSLMVLPPFLNELYNTPSPNLISKDQFDSKITLGVSLIQSGQEKEPKIDKGGYLENSGSPKECNFYCDTRGHNNWKVGGRSARSMINFSLSKGAQSYNFFSTPTGKILKRTYTSEPFKDKDKDITIPTDKKMKDSKGKNQEYLIRDINPSYKELFNKDIYMEAYNRIKSKPGNMTPGPVGLTLDEISLNWIDNTIRSMKDRSFQFKPSSRVLIQKSNGKIRALGIPSPRDKVIQQAVRMILEAKFEPMFSEFSHGFRPSRSPHTAIYEVRKWSCTTWIIEGDIKGYFDNIDHKILAEQLQRQIKDQNLIDLYWKLVKAGYINNGKFVESNLGVPQGGILSPLLSNIYLHDFDVFMSVLTNKNTTPGRVSQPNPRYYFIRNALKKGYNAELYEELLITPSVIRIGTRVRYNRFADDWIIGITGNKDFAEMIKQEATKFLNENLKLEVSQEKTKITNISSEAATYLGFEIRKHDRKYKEYLRSTVNTKDNSFERRATNTRIILYAPIQKLLKKLETENFLVKGQPRSINKFIFLHPHEIVTRYSAIMRGIYNYYTFVDNKNLLQQILWILRFSCVYTLARKLRLSVKGIFKKYGNQTKILHNKKTIMLFKPETLKRNRKIKVDNYLNFDR